MLVIGLMKARLLIFISFISIHITCYDPVKSQIVETSHKQIEALTPERKRISDAAIAIIKPSIVYDPSYFSIKYPMGDVPSDRGVCTDVLIRTYRKIGIDLQELVHKDMQKHFDLYPKTWGLHRPDTNIDHRRVPNLMTFFKRYGKSLPITNKPDDYRPGDIVVWNLGNGVLHIGIVISRKSGMPNRYMIVHNIGSGQIAEDVLFDWKIIGHYYYSGK